ncbi:nucleoside deaminase [Olivibacter ginsenosidimutans]|uniref:tRNA-specific adenosine deaminase n=1 Tax=Olivibacter ginsenosidimutans TaxID=1176537 RepID=A0ABP9C7K2_9SPHI
MRYINFEDTTDTVSDEFFMKEALLEAKKALDADEVPIGAVVVHNNKIIARGHNLTETLNDVTAHAEMQAFTAAAHYIGGKYLKECTLYVTVEPCVMCAGASYWSQINRIVFGTRDEKRGYSNVSTTIVHPKTTVISGILERECRDLIQQFFQSKRL